MLGKSESPQVHEGAVAFPTISGTIKNVNVKVKEGIPCTAVVFHCFHLPI